MSSFQSVLVIGVAFLSCAYLQAGCGKSIDGSDSGDSSFNKCFNMHSSPEQAEQYDQVARAWEASQQRIRQAQESQDYQNLTPEERIRAVATGSPVHILSDNELQQMIADLERDVGNGGMSFDEIDRRAQLGERISKLRAEQERRNRRIATPATSFVTEAYQQERANEGLLPINAATRDIRVDPSSGRHFEVTSVPAGDLVYNSPVPLAEGERVLNMDGLLNNRRNPLVVTASDSTARSTAQNNEFELFGQVAASLGHPSFVAEDTRHLANLVNQTAEATGESVDLIFSGHGQDNSVRVGRNSVLTTGESAEAFRRMTQGNLRSCTFISCNVASGIQDTRAPTFLPSLGAVEVTAFTAPISAVTGDLTQDPQTGNTYYPTLFTVPSFAREIHVRPWNPSSKGGNIL